jgi:hypothetical protein
MTFQKHIDAIISGEVTKTNIIGLRKAINAMGRRRANLSVSTTCPKATEDEVIEALYLIGKHRPKVMGDLHTSGVKLLQSKRHAKRLTAYADIIERPSHFELYGFDLLGRYGNHSVPVYRLVGENGGSFNFRNIPWQSGGNGPEIV